MINIFLNILKNASSCIAINFERNILTKIKKKKILDSFTYYVKKVVKITINQINIITKLLNTLINYYFVICKKNV